MNVEVRAIVLAGDRLLIADERRTGRPHMSIPGGNVNDRETTTDALVREVKEETGVSIVCGPLVYIAEIVSGVSFHDLNLVFLATPVESVSEETDTLLDLSRKDIDELSVFPPILGQIAADYKNGWSEHPKWLGNIWRPQR